MNKNLGITDKKSYLFGVKLSAGQRLEGAEPGVAFNDLKSDIHNKVQHTVGPAYSKANKMGLFIHDFLCNSNHRYC